MFKEVVIEMLKSRKEIAMWLNDHDIEIYTINEDLSVDVAGSVKLSVHSYSNGGLPFKFGSISGNFDCSGNQLSFLENFPYEVLGDFYCGDNYLTSLLGCPDKVMGCFCCENNSITSLVGCPELIGLYFNCSSNNLTDLRGCPKIVLDGFHCVGNKLTTLDYMPEVVKGIFDCRYNGGLLAEVELLDFEQIKQYVSNKNLKESLDMNLDIGLVIRSISKKI